MAPLEDASRADIAARLAKLDPDARARLVAAAAEMRRTLGDRDLPEVALTFTEPTARHCEYFAVQYPSTAWPRLKCPLNRPITDAFCW